MKGRGTAPAGRYNFPAEAFAADALYRRNSLAALIRVTTRELKEATQNRRAPAEIEEIRKRRQTYVEMLRRLSAAP